MLMFLALAAASAYASVWVAMFLYDEGVLRGGKSRRQHEKEARHALREARLAARIWGSTPEETADPSLRRRSGGEGP
jgi:hypothetical protein